MRGSSGAILRISYHLGGDTQCCLWVNVATKLLVHVRLANFGIFGRHLLHFSLILVRLYCFLFLKRRALEPGTLNPKPNPQNCLKISGR